MIEEIDALGATRYFTYDDDGDLTRYVDRNGRVRQYEYDAEHRVTSETWYAGVKDAESAQSDPIPNAQSPIPASNTIRYEYDKAGNLISESDDDSSIVYVYDTAGNLLSTTTASLDMPTVVLTNEYDDAEGATAGLSGSARRTRLSAAIDGVADFVNEYRYDDLGRITAFGQYGVDKGGNAVAEKFVDLSYDSAGNLAYLHRYAADGQSVGRTFYSHDALGQWVGMVHHEGQSILAGYRWRYSESSAVSRPSADASSNPQSLIPNPSSPSVTLPMHDTSAIVDALLNGTYTGALLTSMYSSSDGRTTYAYDSTGQLTGATHSDSNPQSLIPNPLNESYTYDANGNRTGDGYVIGTDNRLLSDGTYWYAYDAEGNRTARYVDVDQSGTLSESDTDVTEYVWDHRNRLVQVTDYEKQGGPATQVVDYVYDTENRWIGKVLDPDGDLGDALVEQTAFVYDGNQIVLQFTGTGSEPLEASDLSHRYLWQPDVVDQLIADEQVTSLKEPGDVLWALGDHLGTVRDLAVYDEKADLTTIANHRVFDSYGNLVSETNAAVDCLFGYTGRAYDEATGLQDNWHRKYDASTGGWISKDPIGLTAGDTNTGRYVANSPTNATDPTGLDRIIGNDPDDTTPVMGAIKYLDEGLVFPDEAYDAGTRVGIIVTAKYKNYFYSDLVQAAQNGEIGSQAELDTFIQKAQKKYEQTVLVMKVVEKLKKYERDERVPEKKQIYNVMWQTVERIYCSKSRGAEASILKMLDCSTSFGKYTDFLRETVGDCEIAISSGQARGAGELVGYIRYIDDAKILRRKKVVLQYPKWLQETKTGGKSLTGAEFINSIDWASKGIGAGIGTERLVKSWANNDPTSTLESLKGLIEIGASLSGPGVSEYIGVMTGAVDAAIALLSEVERTQLTLNAQSLISGGLTYSDIGGPLSRAWFREQAPLLAIKYPWF